MVFCQKSKNWRFHLALICRICLKKLLFEDRPWSMRSCPQIWKQIFQWWIVTCHQLPEWKIVKNPRVHISAQALLMCVNVNKQNVNKPPMIRASKELSSPSEETKQRDHDHVSAVCLRFWDQMLSFNPSIIHVAAMILILKIKQVWPGFQQVWTWMVQCKNSPPEAEYSLYRERITAHAVQLTGLACQNVMFRRSSQNQNHPFPFHWFKVRFSH